MPFLCADPALQDRLHAQALDVLGTATVCAGFDDLRRLDPFEAAATEATRLKPIVPLLFMEPLQDVELGGFAIPAGTPLFFVLRPAMRDARNFGRPDEYLPERWATGHGQVQPHDMHAYAQFGAGPRMCPGRFLAGVELRLVLSMLLRHFRLSLAVPPGEIREVMAFTMMPDRMPVRLQAR
jgi:cytochrome P450